MPNWCENNVSIATELNEEDIRDKILNKYGKITKEWDNKSKGKTISRPGLTLDDCKRACIAEKGDYNSIVYNIIMNTHIIK